jgi:hypothetical protein
MTLGNRRGLHDLRGQEESWTAWHKKRGGFLEIQGMQNSDIVMRCKIYRWRAGGAHIAWS